jgi:predicted PurR-regulated permease PerM
MPTTTATDAATPIWISRRTRSILVGAALAGLALILWRAPTLAAVAVGGGALALVLSFPVRALSRKMPRRAAIVVSLILVVALIGLTIAYVVPIVVDQLGALVGAAPGIARRLEAQVPPVLDQLATRGLLPTSPERFLEDLRQRLVIAVQAFAGRLVGGLGQFLSGAAGVVAGLLATVFVAVYLLTDARSIHAAVLRATPHRYRRDVRALSDAFGLTLSRYLGGLAISVMTEGLLAAIVFHALGIPYAFLLGAWVSVMAIIPYVGAWIGYAPAVLLALAISPTRALLTVLLCLLINALVGNVLSPRIQGQAVRVHPVVVFLAVIAGGELFGLPGAVFAVPTVALLRVLYDFFRIRLRVEESSVPG